MNTLSSLLLSKKKVHKKFVGGSYPKQHNSPDLEDSSGKFTTNSKLKFELDADFNFSCHKRVLIVEDDLALKIVLTQLLYSVDDQLDICWCTTVDEAFEELQKMGRGSNDYYDMIFSDIFTPGVTSGYDIWKICKKEFPFIPVVLTSGISNQEFLNNVTTQLTPPPYLQKPLRFSECKNVFREILTSE